MPQAINIIIHEFERHKDPVHIDDDGDPMFGFYFQFTDIDDQPVTGMIGPYSYNRDAEKAARKAFDRSDF